MMIATAEVLALLSLRRSTTDSIRRLAHGSFANYTASRHNSVSTKRTQTTPVATRRVPFTIPDTKTRQQQTSHEETTGRRSDGIRSSIAENFSSYEGEMSFRRNQARRSIFVKLERRDHFGSFLEKLPAADDCVQHTFFFGTADGYYYSIVEFKRVEQMTSFLKSNCTHWAASHKTLPCTPRMLLFNHQEREPDEESRNRESPMSRVVRNYTQSYALGPFDLNNAAFRDRLDALFFTKKPTSGDCNNQIRHLYLWSRIDELGYRLRFLVASLIEDPFRGLFDRITCLPFGSSMNRYGDKSSDLDMSLSLGGEPSLDERLHTSDNHQVASEEASFRFISKQHTPSRQASQFFQLLSHLMTQVYPMFTLDNVKTGSQSPCAKFDFSIVPKLNCSLTITQNASTYQMSKLIWTYSRLDERVTRLMYLVKYWAKLLTLTTKERPSPSLTDFQLSLMVIHFLLRMPEPIVLPLDQMAKRRERTNVDGSGKRDNNDNETPEYSFEPYLDIKKLRERIQGQNDIRLSELFQKFLAYYSHFDHQRQRVSILATSKPYTSNSHRGLFIENPLFPEVNAAANVNANEMDRFVRACNASYDLIQSLKLKHNGTFNLVEFFVKARDELTKIQQTPQQTRNPK